MPDELRISTRSIHQSLRDATRADHVHLESALNLLDPSLTRERYRHVLAAFHDFYLPLEAQFERFHRSIALTLDFELPHRALLLEADLDVLGHVPAANDGCRMPEIHTLAEFAGRLYVVEGAALGGQVLARSLAGRWKLHGDAGIAFFSGAGPLETGRRWTRVLAWLEKVVPRDADARELLMAASATFRALERGVDAQVARA